MIDRGKIRKLVKEFLLPRLEDEVDYTHLCDIVLEKMAEPNTEGPTDEEWDKAQAIIDEALGECKDKIKEILT